MDKNVRKCVLIASAFAAVSMGNVPQVWASEFDLLEVAQQNKKQIKGKVVDATGEAVIGANVLEKGTTNGVITDIDGNFVLNVSTGAILEISYIGYVSQTVKVTNQTSLNIVLKEDSETLDEVVVVGYGTMKKSDLTGSVSRVNQDDVKRMSTSDVVLAMQGRVAGVSVIANSGEPGAGAKVRVRGVGTINNSDPLYIVDGFPHNDIAHLSSNDIESIEILKDASATAIYGSRGANGVIMVKTKSGALDRPVSVNANAYVSFSDVVNRIDMLNASEYATLKSEAYANADMPLDVNMESIFAEVLKNNSVGTNWQDEIFRTGISQNYNVNVSGGGKKNAYDIGVTWSREEGTVKYTQMDKLLVHANNEYKFSDHVKAGVNIYYQHYNKTGNNSDLYSGALTSALRTDPISAAWDEEKDFFGEVYFTYGTNPAFAAYKNKYNRTSSDQFNVNSYLQIDDIGIKGLSFRAQFGANLTYAKNKNYSPEYYITANQKNEQSSLYERRAQTIDWSTTEYLSYQNSFNKHSLNLTLGFEAQKFQSNDMAITVYDVPEDFNMQYISASTNKTAFLASGGANHSALVSYFFRGNYTFDNKYLLTATVRADGTSRFLNRWGVFPSFSAGWNIYQEDFFLNSGASKFISQLKLRAGWGQVGNQNSAGYYDYVSLMTNGYTYVFGDTPVDGAIQETVANRELSWETAEQYNVGIDFGLFNNRLSGNVDYFIRNTNDMILATPIPMYVGMWRPRTNVGSIQNRGIEFSLNYADSFKDLEYNVGLNMSFIKNEVTSIGNSDPIYGGSISKVGEVTRTEKGREIAYFYGLQTDGIFNTQEELDAHVDKDGNKIQPNAGLGDVKFVDLNGDGKIDGDDRTYLGSAMPDFTFGFNAGLAYKGFDFNLFLQGSVGNEIVNGMYNNLYSTDMFEYSVCKDMMNRWTEDNPTSNIPRVHASDPNKNTQFSDLYVEDGSYLRIKNVQLGYTLPSRLTNKIRVKKLRVYVSADNLLTLTSYRGFDPEIGDLDGPLGAGVDLATYPVLRVFSVGFNLNF